MYDHGDHSSNGHHRVDLEALRTVGEDLVDVRLSAKSGKCTYVGRRSSFKPRAVVPGRPLGRKGGAGGMVRHLVSSGVPIREAVLSAAETRRVLREELRRSLKKSIRRHHEQLWKELERRKALVPLWRRMWLRARFVRASSGVAEVLRCQLDYITTPRRDGEEVNGDHFRMAFQHYDAATRILDKQAAHLRHDLVASLRARKQQHCGHDAHQGGDVTYVRVRRGHMPALF